MFGVCCLCFAVPFYGTSSQRSMDDKSEVPRGSVWFSSFLGILLYHRRRGLLAALQHGSGFVCLAEVISQEALRTSSLTTSVTEVYSTLSPPVSCPSTPSSPIPSSPILPSSGIENAIHDGGIFISHSPLETNEDKTFVKSPKKWAVRLSVLVFVVAVGTFYPKFKDIISFDILSVPRSRTLDPTGQLRRHLRLFRSAFVPALEADPESVHHAEGDRLDLDRRRSHSDGRDHPPQFHSSVKLCFRAFVQQSRQVTTPEFPVFSPGIGKAPVPFWRGPPRWHPCHHRPAPGCAEPCLPVRPASNAHRPRLRTAICTAGTRLPCAQSPRRLPSQTATHPCID